MAGENNLLNKLAALVAAFDDASWEALASKGLLRRARKDLEKGLEIRVVEESGDVLKLEVPPFVVSMPAAGPGSASCSCPTPGVCQHIIAAGLYLQQQPVGPTEERVSVTPELIRDEIVLLTPETLKAWIGTTEYRKGVALLEKNSMPPVIEYTDTVLVRLLPSDIEIRFVPGGGLDGMILPKVHGKRAGVAAILALRKSFGFEIPVTAAQQSLVDLSGTPRTKKEILDSACSVLEDAISVGLTHVSEVLVNRLVTLAVSAQGAHMPRVSLALKTVGDEVRSILQREARADEARLLLLIARVYALMDAIRSGGENQSVELAGTSRGQYVDVPEIELSGVGAYTWQTGSGYVGLTVMFWADQTKEFLSWSYARPEIQRADARQRFFGEGPWDGTQSPQQVAGSRLKLRRARRTVNGRLSGSTKTSALVLSPVAPQTLDFGERLFRSWEDLHHYAATKQALGLRDPNPLESIVVLRPSEFGVRSFDSIEQVFSWEIYDENDELLTLTLPFRDWTKESIKILEQLSPPKNHDWKFVVKLTREDEKLFVEPISILRPEDVKKPVFNLAFDTLVQPGLVDTMKKKLTALFEDEPGIEPEEEVLETELRLKGALSQTLREINKHLEAIAETGIRSGLAAHRDWFTRSHREVHGFGLTALADILHALSTASSPDSIVKARYLTHLHSQAAAHLNH